MDAGEWERLFATAEKAIDRCPDKKLSQDALAALDRLQEEAERLEVQVFKLRRFGGA